MLSFFTVIHVLLCVFMIFVILLQPGKDAGMGAALGGGVTQTAFGGRGAVTFLTKVTAICAIGYFVTSLGLSFVGMKQSVVADIVAPADTTPAAETKTDGKTDGKTDVKVDEAAKAAAPTPDAPAGNVGQDSADKAPAGKAAESDKPTGTEAVPADKR